MNVSAEEKIMYEVMKALYDSGIPVSFKGSMVLKACLMEAGFTDDTRHTVDIDGNRPAVPTQIYEIAGVKFLGVAPKQMIADKISVISSDKIFRRIKDVVDMYYISQVFEFDVDEVLKTLNDCGRKLGNFNGFINRTEDLRHSYDKFRFSGGVNKPAFEEVYDSVKTFIKDIIPNS